LANTGRTSDVIVDIWVSNNKTVRRVSVTTLSGVLDDLIETTVVDAGDLAQVTGSTARSVSRWTTAKAVPRRDAEDRLLELKAVVDQLLRVLGDESARLWLRSPSPALDWQKPLDLISEGNYRLVVGAVLALAEGVTA
jgi:putative toxin-antitoxin system antitoxin component (TIGR02293 family)